MNYFFYLLYHTKAIRSFQIALVIVRNMSELN